MSCAATTQDPNTGGSDTTDLLIHARVGECWLGCILVGMTERGICAILLGDDPAILRRDLQERFAQARIVDGDQALDLVMAEVVDFIARPGQGLYGEIAERIGAPEEAYAVGEACAANMIAVAIPCHRVVRKNGGLAGYRWGFRRKRALLKRERAS
jgi:AraC family transcriptional regulator, regulatory protein of adaptative response / methylated-DNA-[protein]-cysteine methyltransferase